MATISRTYGPATANPVATGSTILAAHVNTDFDTIYADYNGNITNANISASAAISISKTALGTYTAWTNWSPTYTCNAGTWTSVTGTARYTQIGKTVYVNLYAVGTTNSTPATLHFTLPIAPTQTTDLYIGGGALVYQNGTSSSGFFNSTYTSDGVVKVKHYAGTPWTASGSNGFNLNFHYEVN